MLKETMSKIKAAEDEANQIIKNSEAEAIKILEEAQKKAADIKQEVVASGKQNVVKLSDFEKTEREKEIKASLSDADNEISALRNQVRQKEEPAINLIVSLLT